MKTKIISAFPGTGKSYFYEYNKSIRTHDSDSSDFSWIYDDDGTKHRNPEFPANYVKHIRELLDFGGYEYIFISSHKQVRDALREADIAHTLVYPNRQLKDAYLIRFRNRGSNEDFIQQLDKLWDIFIDSCQEDNDKGDYHILEEGQFLQDVLPVTVQEPETDSAFEDKWTRLMVGSYISKLHWKDGKIAGIGLQKGSKFIDVWVGREAMLSVLDKEGAFDKFAN